MTLDVASAEGIPTSEGTALPDPKTGSVQLPHPFLQGFTSLLLGWLVFLGGQITYAMTSGLFWQSAKLCKA